MPELTTILAHHPDCTIREIGDGLVIMAPRDTSTHSLEDLGAFIWRQFDGTRDLAGVLAAVLAEYDVPQEQALADLQKFCDELLAAELLQEAGK